MAYFAVLMALASFAMAAPAPAPAALETRQNVQGYWQGNCFGTELDHHDVDASHDALYGWASSSPVINSGDHNEYVPFQSGNVIAYACTDDHNGSNFFNDDDVNAAYKAMDDACPLYTASWAIYVQIFGDPNGFHYTQNTGKIIGKDTAQHPVCQGSDGN